MSKLRLGIVMDPISDITPAKDSSLAMLLEAQNRDHEILYFEQADLRLYDGVALGTARQLRVEDDSSSWFEFGDSVDMRLADLDVLLMRKDPPFDTEYIYTTYILERAELAGVLVINRPQSLRDMNEKVYTAWFPEFCPETVITRSMREMKSFLRTHGRIVVKPLYGMGGRSIFVVGADDNNANVIFETLTDYETQFAMAQQFIPEIAAGDKRILLVGGKPAPFALARVPSSDDYRGNLVAGAQPEVRELSPRDREIAETVGAALQELGVSFAGLDVIGDYLTEINVTSPTGIRELKKLADIDVAADLLDLVESTAGSGKAAA
ncbi:MAG: glutathione synthase [Gammaproteobacteria bacterium]|nr:glutathione synthase [Gammaproteobacteria bacterium]MBT8443393.1 glutathione synthase [Gammaproteobacteria bacterium]NND37948.1 glutathione synthase [Gammaproteobacteria bacterium]